MTFLVPIVKFFFLTKNGNQKGHEYHKGLKIANFSYLMRSKVTLPRFAEVNFNSLKSIGHVGWSRNCRFAGLGRPWVILGKSSFYLMKSAENSWVCSGSMNTTVHWAYRGQVLSLISNLQYHTDPGKNFFWKSEHVHFLNIFWQNQTMRAVSNETLKSLWVYCAAVIYFLLRLQFIAVTRPMFRPPPLFHFSLH